MNKHLLILILTSFSQTFVTAQTTDFTYANNNSETCLPIDIKFTQTSSGAPEGYLWDFGNGTHSNNANPVATYMTAGTYTVRLITVYANNTAEKTKNITVHPAITTSFSYDKGYLCQPGVINFTANTSGSLASYVWDFGDSTALVTGTSALVAHNYMGFGDFTVTLKALSPSGCAALFTKTVKVIEPELVGSISSPLTGCIPANTSFHIAVSSLPPNSSVISYLWNFGTGNAQTINSTQVSHNYNVAGAYSPSVTITTGEGCTKKFTFDSLFFGNVPLNHVAYPVDTVYCGSETPQFVSHATNANRYDWDFTGSGNITSVTDTLAEHRYTNLGVKHITVTPLYNGCAGTPINFHINIIGVIAKFKYANTCSDRKTFLLDNNSQGHISSVNWTLDAQSSSVNTDTVSHTYPQTGAFPVKLLIADDITGCIDSFKATLYTANPVLKNDDRAICINTDTHFSLLNNYTNPVITYTWNALGQSLGPVSDSAPVFHADTLGYFNSTVVINNGIPYCPDTLQLDHMITVKGPKLDFTAPQSICLNTALTVVNLSQPFQSADTVHLWYWNFGRVASNDTVFQPSPYTYVIAKAYKIKLTAVDISGCMDTLVKKVYVRPMPFIWIIPKMTTLCQGQQTTLIGYTSDSISWSAVNPNFCTSCDTTMVSPHESTNYYATVNNSFGCSAVDSSVVKVMTPFTATPLTPDASFCGGKTVQLDVEPKNMVISWSPAEGVATPTQYNTEATPKQSTVYTATLTDSSGCFSSHTDIHFSIKPSPVVEAGPNKEYAYNAAFQLNTTHSSNITSWLWTPGDSLDCNTCAAPSGIALRTKTFSVTVTSDSGCTAQAAVTIFVECNGANLLMPTAFTPNHDSRNDRYRPIAHGMSYIKRFAVYNREGELVYEALNYVPNKSGDGWDGTYKGRDQAPAAYMYFVEAVCDKGQSIFSKGSFILIR